MPLLLHRIFWTMFVCHEESLTQPWKNEAIQCVEKTQLHFACPHVNWERGLVVLLPDKYAQNSIYSSDNNPCSHSLIAWKHMFLSVAASLMCIIHTEQCICITRKGKGTFFHLPIDVYLEVNFIVLNNAAFFQISGLNLPCSGYHFTSVPNSWLPVIRCQKSCSAI